MANKEHRPALVSRYLHGLMEPLKDGLTCLISGAFGSCHRHCPYWHMRGSDAIANAGARLLRASCSQLSHTADLTNLQVDAIQSFPTYGQNL